MRRNVTPLVTLSLIAMIALVASCSNDTTGTTGGGGGPTKELNSPNLGNGAQYAHMFANTGTFNYHCTFHGSMTGQVVVGGSGAPMSVSVSISGNAFMPSSVSVAQNGTVTWTNMDGTTHTVTSD